VRPDNSISNTTMPFEEAYENWSNSVNDLKLKMDELFKIIGK
jgi:hypothetical protein